MYTCVHVCIHAFMYLCTVAYSHMKHAGNCADNDPLMNLPFPDLPHAPSDTPKTNTVASTLTSVSIGPTLSREEVTDTFPVALGPANDLGFTSSSFTAMARVYSVAPNNGEYTIFGTDKRSKNKGLHFVVRLSTSQVCLVH